jgi:hypothetical protein
MVEEGGRDLYGVSLTGETPSALLDLVSICRDLGLAERLFLLLAALEGAEDTDPVVTTALYATAAISYRRCFAEGAAHERGRKRHRVAYSEADVMPPEVRAVHDEMLASADQHIAHRINEEQQASAFLLLAPPTEEPAIEGCAELFFDEVSKGAGWYIAASGIVSGLRAGMTAMANDVRDRLLAEMAEMPLDELYEQASPLAINVDVQEAGTRKRR